MQEQPFHMRLIKLCEQRELDYRDVLERANVSIDRLKEFQYAGPSEAEIERLSIVIQCEPEELLSSLTSLQEANLEGFRDYLNRINAPEKCRPEHVRRILTNSDRHGLPMDDRVYRDLLRNEDFGDEDSEFRDVDDIS